MNQLLNYFDLDTLIKPDVPTILQQLELQGSRLHKIEVVNEFLKDRSFRLPYTPDKYIPLIAFLAEEFLSGHVLNVDTGTGKLLYRLDLENQPITGIERSPSASALARYLNPSVNILEGDVFWYPFDRKFDSIIADIQTGPKVDYQGARMPREQALILRALELLEDFGHAVLVMPTHLLKHPRFDDFLSQYQPHFRQFIYLPSVRQQYARKKSTIIVLSKQPADDVVHVNLENFSGKLREGFELKVYYQKKAKALSRLPTPPELAQFRLTEAIDMVKLGSMADLLPGLEIPPQQLNTAGDLLYLRNLDLHHGLAQAAPSWRFVNRDALDPGDVDAILSPGDLILSMFFRQVILFEYTNEHPPALASANQLIIRSTAPDYIRSYLLQLFSQGVPEHLLDSPGRFCEFKLADTEIPVVQFPDMDLLGDRHISRLSSDEVEDLMQQLRNLLHDIDNPPPPPPIPTSYSPITVERLDNDDDDYNEPPKRSDSGMKFQIVPDLPSRLPSSDDLHNDVFESIDSVIVPPPKQEKVVDEDSVILLSARIIHQDLEEPEENPPVPFADFDNDQLRLLLQFFESRFKVMENKLNEIQSSINSVAQQVADVNAEIQQIRLLPRDIDEKFLAFNHALDTRMNLLLVQSDTLAQYRVITESWLSFWHALETDSQRFLPTAEYIYDVLARTPDADFAPFVIQYCRSLENEMLNKLFVNYHRNWVRSDSRHRLIQGAINYAPVQRFAEKVRDDHAVYSLGEMTYIMRQIQSDASIWRNNTLLSDFREYTLSHFRDNIVRDTFLNQLGKLTSEIRNRAAHADRVDLPMAMECQTLLRSCLNTFLYSLI